MCERESVKATGLRGEKTLRVKQRKLRLALHPHLPRLHFSPSSSPFISSPLYIPPTLAPAAAARLQLIAHSVRAVGAHGDCTI